MSKPRILIARTVFPEVVARLQQHFDVTDNQADVAWTKAEWTDRLREHVGAFSMGIDPVDEAVLQACPQLKICANMSVGYNNLDVPAMTRHGVLATNAPDVLTETTADFGFALMMAAARRVTESEHFLRAGQWKQWRYDLFAGAEVHGSTLGIMGMGRIGQAIARRGALGFGMQVIYHHTKDLKLANRKFVGINELASTSDVISLHCPLTEKTDRMINSEFLSLMKSSSILINTSRGGLIHSLDLKSALVSGQISAALLDVLEVEPPAVGHPLIGITNAIITPHIAWISLEARKRIVTSLENTLKSYIEGKVVNCVNP